MTDDDGLTPENLAEALKLPQDEMLARLRVLEANTQRTFDPVDPADLGLEKARMPTTSRGIGRQRPDGSIETVDGDRSDDAKEDR